MTNFDAVLTGLIAFLSVLEVVLRVVPTKGNFSLLMRLIVILDGLKLVKNRKTGGGSFVAKTEVH